ncbi:MAG: DUF456 domain-containing protein [Verrucomicrobiota bacterium]
MSTLFTEVGGEIVVWVLLLVGLVGSILPIIPGTPLIFVGIVIHKVLFPEQLSWWIVAFLGLCVALAILLEWIGGMVGARYFGASAWGVWGALIGGIIGLFFAIPGLILGPLLGAFLFEFALAKKSPKEAGKAGFGVMVGIIGSNVTHFLIALAMILVFCLDAYLW